MTEEFRVLVIEISDNVATIFQQRPLAEQIMKISRVGLGGPYNTLLRSPVLGQRMFDLLHYLRWNSSVPLRLE